MDRQQLSDAVTTTIVRIARIDADNIRPDTVLTELGMDSLDLMNLAATLEVQFKFTITTAELTHIRTFADILDELERKLPDVD